MLHFLNRGKSGVKATDNKFGHAKTYNEIMNLRFTLTMKMRMNLNLTADFIRQFYSFIQVYFVHRILSIALLT